MEYLTWATDHWPQILEIIAGIIAVASVIVKLTPTAKDNEILKKFRKLFELLALTPRDRQR